MLVNVNPHFKMLLAHYLYFHISKFPKKANKLEINKKKSPEAWENKSRKDDIDDTWRRQSTRHYCHESAWGTRARRAQDTSGTWGTRHVRHVGHEGHKGSEAREQVEHEAREAQEHVGYKARDTREHAKHKTLEALEHVRYEAHEAQEYVRHNARRTGEHVRNVIKQTRTKQIRSAKMPLYQFFISC